MAGFGAVFCGGLGAEPGASETVFGACYAYNATTESEWSWFANLSTPRYMYGRVQMNNSHLWISGMHTYIPTNTWHLSLIVLSSVMYVFLTVALCNCVHAKGTASTGPTGEVF